MLVTKRNNTTETVDLTKIHRVVEFCCEGLTASASAVELSAELQFFDGIQTSAIQQALVNSAVSLITSNHDYQYVAGRLIMCDMYKTVYRGKTPFTLANQIARGVSAGIYCKETFDTYTAEQLQFLDQNINHANDFERAACSVAQLGEKYLLKNKIFNIPFETPNMAFMLISMAIHHQLPESQRLDTVVDYYRGLSSGRISLPTPMMARCRTPEKQWASCTVVDCGDSLESIKLTTCAIIDYVSNLAGLGINAGRIRAVNSSIKNGLKTHTGLTGFIRLFEAAIMCCNSGGVRKGSGNLNFMFWHLEVMNLIVLKNDEGTIENRARFLDYTMHTHSLLAKRYQEDGVITLFSPHQVPKLYEAFYSKDPKAFIALYEEYEKRDDLTKSTVSARHLLHRSLEERKKTQRLYFMSADNVNTHSTWEEYVYLTNLCVEIGLPTKPIASTPAPSVGLCVLSALNLSEHRAPHEMQKTCEQIVMGLNQVIDTQDYMLQDAWMHTKKYRPLGVGFMGLAHFFARHRVSYGTPDCLNLVHEWAEAFAYYLIDASCNFARDYGVRAQGTLFSEGILPIDTYKRTVDELVAPVYKMPWEDLRSRLKKYGIANGCLMAQMPGETSAQTHNTPSGIEPLVSLVTLRNSGTLKVLQVAPESDTLGPYYDLRNSHAGPRGYLAVVAVLQKFFCQLISANTSYNKFLFPIKPGETEHKIPMEEMVDNFMFSQYYGIKSWYYLNNVDGNSKDSVVQMSEAECESCSL